MKETLNTVRVGLFCLLGLTVIWIVYETLQEGRLLAEETYPLYGHFENVSMLRPGDDIRVSGVRVGRVNDVRLRDGEAEAVLDLEDGIRIPRDSVATVAVSSLLGGNYVSIDRGTSDEFLNPGDAIATKHTADLSEVVAQLGDMTGRVDDLFEDISDVMAAITGTPEEPGAIDQVNAILAENREALNASLENIREITDKVNRGEGTLARLINDDEAYDNLMAAVDELGKAGEDASELTAGAGEIMAHIRSGEGTLGSLIYGDELAREMEATAANLREVSNRLAQGEGTLGRLLVDDALYLEVQGLIQRAERTLEGLNEQGPITATGVAAGALF